jgi:hypothetical protein
VTLHPNDKDLLERLRRAAFRTSWRYSLGLVELRAKQRPVKHKWPKKSLYGLCYDEEGIVCIVIRFKQNGI